MGAPRRLDPRLANSAAAPKRLEVSPCRTCRSPTFVRRGRQDLVFRTPEGNQVGHFAYYASATSVANATWPREARRGDTPPEATTDGYVIVTFWGAQLPKAGGLQNTPDIESAAQDEPEVTMSHERTVSVPACGACLRRVRFAAVLVAVLKA